MEILYIGSFYPEDRFDEIWQNSKQHYVATTVFQRALIKGWKENNYKNVTVLTFPMIGSFPRRYNKLYFKRSSLFSINKESVCEGFLNLPVIKHIDIFFKTKRYISKWVKKNKDHKKVIIINSMALNIMKAVIDIKNKYPDVKVCLSILDLPEFSNSKSSNYKTKIINFSVKKSFDLLKYIDSYILISSAIYDKINIKDKPWMLLEGIYLPSDRDSIHHIPSDKVIILYTGSLHLKYGIEDLLLAFDKINDKNYELRICGDGDGKTLINEYIAHNNRIKFLGMLKHTEVLELQKNATLLVNPRRASEEYTKYSFPSKTIEYMASGTPVIMHKLEGIPPEYYEHLIFTESSSIDDLYKTMIAWGEKPKEDLENLGLKAKKFILDNKTAFKQSQRVMEFLSLN